MQDPTRSPDEDTPLSGRWMVTGVGHEGERPLLELRAQAGETKRVEPIGDRIDLRLVGPRRCIGYRAPGSTALVMCPHSAELARGSQCESCVESARMIACLRCTGLRCGNPERRDECVRPDNHAVYLASFGPGATKVGVARWNRRHQRLVEQGALAALVIARDDGQMARRLETTIRAFGVADRASGPERLAALWSDDEPAALRAELALLAAGLRRRLLSAPWLERPEALELPALTRLSSPVPTTRPRADERLCGRILACAGRWIVIEREDGRREGVELSSLVGLSIEPESEALGTPAAEQLALPLA